MLAIMFFIVIFVCKVDKSISLSHFLHTNISQLNKANVTLMLRYGKLVLKHPKNGLLGDIKEGGMGINAAIKY